MALFYAVASALVKLVRDEPESDALRTFLADSDLVSSDLVLTDLAPLDGFVTYDERQAAVARSAGLRTMSPGN